MLAFGAICSFVCLLFLFLGRFLDRHIVKFL